MQTAKEWIHLHKHGYLCCMIINSPEDDQSEPGNNHRPNDVIAIVSFYAVQIVSPFVSLSHTAPSVSHQSGS